MYRQPGGVIFVILCFQRRRIFFVVQGGFQIGEATRTNGTRASKFENNAVIRKKDKPLHIFFDYFRQNLHTLNNLVRC
ncbi:MAG: hypothetical protein J6C83_03075, partial [Peptococcaceae bacterium]|nr:hypothetical protein [Peptococcaceae bacterium]